MAILKKYHVRSISLPSRSHPSTTRVHEELTKLKTWEETSTSTSTSTSGSIHTSLSLLQDLCISLDDLLNMPSTQQVISQHRDHKCVEEVLDGSMRILDICGITRDTMLQIKENVQSLHSSLRRRKGCVETSVAEYKFFTKKMKKNANKLITSLKHMDTKFGVSPVMDHQLDLQLTAVIRVLREVIAMNLSVFQFILSFLTVSSSKSKSNKWFLVEKLMHKGSLTCEDNSENVNELQCVEASLSTLLSEGTNAHERLEALENAIESIENGLENLFRRLIKTRASLLNIISQ